MNRKIKFRGKRIDNNEWVYGSLDIAFDGSAVISFWVSELLEPENNYYEPVQKWHDVTPKTVGQYTGHKINEVELYEGDILREEIENDYGDERYYVVVTWIKEWCMFVGLLVEEYHNYLQEGTGGLDEKMFWTFPIQYKKYGKRTICGNIYENPNLLNATHPPQNNNLDQ